MPGKKSTQFPEARVESSDGALIAKAVLSGEISDDKIEAFRKFCANNVELAKKYGYPHDPKGKRNFRQFVSRVYKKTKAYLNHEKGVSFSSKFLKDAGFPPKPETFEEIKDKSKLNYVPGRDKVYEDIIDEERKEQQREANAERTFDDDDLDLLGEEAEEAEEVQDIDEAKEAAEVEEIEANTNNNDDTSMEDLTNSMSRASITDRAIAQAILSPQWSTRPISDPDLELYGIKVSRRIAVGQMSVPAGIDHLTMTVRVTADGRAITISGQEDPSRYDATTTLGPDLICDDQELLSIVQRPLRDAWTAESHGLGSVTKKWTVPTPYPVERELRDPSNSYRKAPPGQNGIFNVTPVGDFLWVFFMAKEDPDAILLHESLPQRVVVNRTTQDSRYSNANLAQARHNMYKDNFGSSGGFGGNSSGPGSGSSNKTPRTNKSSKTGSKAAASTGTKPAPPKPAPAASVSANTVPLRTASVDTGNTRYRQRGRSNTPRVSPADFGQQFGQRHPDDRDERSRSRHAEDDDYEDSMSHVSTRTQEA